MCQGLPHFKDAASLSLCPNLHRDSERLKLQSRGSSSGSTQLTMERFTMVSSNLLVSTGYNIVIVPPGRSSLHCFQVSRMAKPAEKPCSQRSRVKFTSSLFGQRSQLHTEGLLFNSEQNHSCPYNYVTSHHFRMHYQVPAEASPGLNCPPKLGMSEVMAKKCHRVILRKKR